MQDGPQPRQQQQQPPSQSGQQRRSHTTAKLHATDAAAMPNAEATSGAHTAVATQERSRRRRPDPEATQRVVAPSASVALANTRDELGHLLDALPDGVVIADEGGHLQFVNHQTAVLFGYPREALLGQPVELLMPARFRTMHPIHRAEYTAAPHLRPMGTGLQLFGKRQDGTEFPVEISLSPITVGGTALVLGTIRDVSRQRLLEQQAREELAGRLALLQAVLDELPVGVYLARGWDGELVLANRQVATVLGAPWPSGQTMAAFVTASGSQVFDVQGRELPSERLATLRALRSGVSVRQHQEVIRHADGTALSILVNAIALDPQVFPYLSEAYTRPENPIPVVLVVHQDVTALAEAERMKDEFVALAAHELRSPVASLLGYAQMLLQAAGPRRQGSFAAPRTANADTPDDASDTPRANGTESAETTDNTADEMPAIPREWQEEAATAVLEASQRLAALTDDLLDAIRLQANRLELRMEPLEVVALVRRVVKRQRMATERHTIRMAPLADDEPLLVEGDVQRLEQVLTNLLSNAIKYSPEGGIIEVEAARRVPMASGSRIDSDGGAAGAGNEWAHIVVRDHGMGIPAGQFDRIFARFGRATNARERGIAGTGLGLYLCRELIERQSGRIWFESREGVGTTFTIALPCWAEQA